MVHHSRYHLSPTGRDLLVVDDSGSHMTPFNGLPMALVEANGLESRGDHVGGTERHAYCHHVRECLAVVPSQRLMRPSQRVRRASARASLTGPCGGGRFSLMVQAVDHVNERSLSNPLSIKECTSPDVMCGAKLLFILGQYLTSPPWHELTVAGSHLMREKLDSQLSEHNIEATQGFGAGEFRTRSDTTTSADGNPFDLDS